MRGLNLIPRGTLASSPFQSPSYERGNEMNTPTITFTTKHHIIAALFIGFIASWGFVMLGGSALNQKMALDAKVNQEIIKW